MKPHARPAPLPESLLQYAWEHRRYNANGLATINGEEVIIVKPGRRNTNQGPDFIEAHVRIAGVDFYGAVELHTRTDQWHAHQHQADAGYNGIVLHVVGESNGALPHRADGTTVPEVAIGARLDYSLLEKFTWLQQQALAIPCAKLIAEVPDFTKRTWVRSLGMGRLVTKATAMETMLAGTKHNWQQLFWVQLAGAMGGPVNKDAFMDLAAGLPIATLARHTNEIEILEALLFGMAGMLHALAVDEYQATLQNHWQHYCTKYGLTPLPEQRFKFMRMRPSGFPTVRLAQLAALLHIQPNLLALLEVPAAALAQTLDAPVSAYWQQHFHFGKRSKRGGAHRLTDDSIGRLLINSILPFAVVYNRYRKREHEAQFATEVLQALPPESNAVVTKYAALNLAPANALESQGLLALHKEYCTPKRCLQCTIGHHILKK